MSLQTIALKPDTSLIETMRRFRAEPEARIIRAKHVRGGDRGGFWSIQFIGPAPVVDDLLQEVPA